MASKRQAENHVPRHEEAESAVLGACLIDPDALAKIPRLEPSHFYVEANRWTFEALLALRDAGRPADLITICDELETRDKLADVGGAAYLTNLVNATPTALNVKHYAHIVWRMAGHRATFYKLQEMLGKVAAGEYIDLDPDILADEVLIPLERVKSTYSMDTEPATWQALEGVIGPTEWAWPGWLPKGFLTLLVGEPGEGKSILALRLCACFLGKQSFWPDGQDFEGGGGMVLWCEAEAAQALNYERALAWDLPLDKMLFPMGDPLVDVQIDNPTHRRAIEQAARRPEVLFVVIDSLSSASSRDENSSETLAVVKWLAELARDIAKPILLLHHLRKKGIMDGDQRITLDRIRGYSGIVQPARVVLALDCPDPGDEKTRRLSVIKNNLGQFPEPLGLQVNDRGIIFCEAPQPPKRVSAMDQAKEALRAILEHGPVRSDEIFGELNGMGISEATANRAKRDLGIVSKKEGHVWYWSLQGQETPPNI